MKNPIELSFTRKERLVVFVIMLLVVLVSAQKYIPFGFEKKEIYESALMIKEKQDSSFDVAESQLHESKESKKFGNYDRRNEPTKNYSSKDKTRKKTFKKEYKKTEKYKPIVKQRQSFRFDPNTISADSLELLGFKKWQAKNWINFRNGGKVYKNKDDLLTIYGIDTALVHELESFAKFPSIPKSPINETKKTVSEDLPKTESVLPKVYQSIDLNASNLEELKALPGIGPKYASRILKFKEILGGYAHKDQLKSVYGMHDSIYELFEKYIEIKTPPDKILINVVDKETLGDHYLVGYKEAKLIVQYRKQHGPFVDAADFNELKGLGEEEKQKIVPYLDFKL